MADSGNESGLKWWLRYVIIPLIGSGGLISVWLSYREHPYPSHVPSNPNATTSPNAAQSPLQNTPAPVLSTPTPAMPAPTKANTTDVPASEPHPQIFQGIALSYWDEGQAGKANRDITVCWDAHNYKGRLYLRQNSDSPVPIEQTGQKTFRGRTSDVFTLLQQGASSATPGPVVDVRINEYRKRSLSTVAECVAW
jgi:hypothetical protein